MENLLKPEKFQLIKAIALSKTKWLRFVDKSIDGSGVTSFEFLKKLVEVEQDDFIERLEITYLEVIDKCGGGQSIAIIDGQRRSIETYRLLWGRMCLFLYFFYRENQFWQEVGLPEMINKETTQVIREDLTRAFQFVDDYYKRQERVSAFRTTDQIIEESAPSPEDFGVNPLRIAEKSKVDVMKVFSYMYDIGLFCQYNGEPVNRQKSKFMKAIGNHFLCDFENYSQAINRAAQEENFMEVFYKLLDAAQKKYEEGV